MTTRKKIMLSVVCLFVGLLAAYTAVFVPFGPTSGPQIDAYDTPGTALLIMDMQVDFLSDKGRLPVAQEQVPNMLKIVNSVLERTDMLKIEPIYIANAFSPFDVISNLFRNQAAVAGSDGARLDPRLTVKGNTIFLKDKPDAFTNPALDAYLRDRRINTLIVAGVFADQCVLATVQGALNRGYKVTVLKEAVAAATANNQKEACTTMKNKGATVLDYATIVPPKKK